MKKDIYGLNVCTYDPCEVHLKNMDLGAVIVMIIFV